MLRLILFISCTLSLLACQKIPDSQKIIDLKGNPSLIPQAESLQIGKASFFFNSSTSLIFADSIAGLSSVSSEFNSIRNQIADRSSDANKIQFQIVKDDSKNPEAYEMEIREEEILISSSTKIGLFWAWQSLKQLYFQYADTLNHSSYLPGLKIKDEPKFKHRGFLLDVCRHFFDKQVVKNYIDLLAYYKMNVLHWHLTEDQGWRIAIDKYPKLTEIAAWRKDSLGNEYGGYYSKNDIREIVDYAEKRNISIIPEIELPGHSQAAIAAYPQLSCTGSPVAVANDWGVFKEIYCAGKDSTFIFLEDVLKEVLELFPSKYIHIGGDEAPKYRWENCSHCQKRMKDENLENEHELQSYFIKRIEKFLNENNRQLIGWDEILEGGLSPNATLQSWRGMEHGKIAAEQEHQVIMSPTSHCYFDYDLKSIDLEKVYSFDPIPVDLAEDYRKYIIGGECNMWTEHVPDEENLDSKVFPRLLAMSEILWTYPKNRDFESFYKRVQDQYPYLEAKNVKYGLEAEAAKIIVLDEGDGLKISLESNLPDLSLSYRKSEKDSFKMYKNPFALNFSSTLEVQANKGLKPYGPSLFQTIKNHKALNSNTQYRHIFNDWYSAGGEKALVNGFLASLDFRDGNWQGFFGEDLEIVLELKHSTTISDIWANFYQYGNAWIFLPKQVEIYTSMDGEIWTKHVSEKLEDKSHVKGKFIESCKFLIYPEAEAKFIKFRALNLGSVPDWHEAAGSKAWIFIDEIIVQ